MADNYLSKVKLGSTTYLLKDNEARANIETLATALASSLSFKGTISSATEITSLTNYKVGWTYKASSDFSISGLGKIENGDMLICIADYSTAYKDSDWAVVQNNVDVMVGATAIAAGARGLVPEPAAADNEKYLRGDGTWSSPQSDIVWGSFSDLI